jgi:hypothetical protein
MEKEINNAKESTKVTDERIRFIQGIYSQTTCFELMQQLNLQE